MRTGGSHWETLLRARAIETQVRALPQIKKNPIVRHDLIKELLIRWTVLCDCGGASRNAHGEANTTIVGPCDDSGSLGYCDCTGARRRAFHATPLSRPRSRMEYQLRPRWHRSQISRAPQEIHAHPRPTKEWCLSPIGLVNLSTRPNQSSLNGVLLTPYGGYYHPHVKQYFACLNLVNMYDRPLWIKLDNGYEGSH